MRILFIADIFGEAGRNMVRDFLPKLKTQYSPDVVIANAENMAGGTGMTPKTYLEIVQAGVDIVTGGNHSFDKKEGHVILDEEPFVTRPANYPKELPGKGHIIYPLKNGRSLGVLNIQGRTFMEPLDCPFKMSEVLVQELRAKTPLIFVDFHAEATSEKIAMAWHLDGKVSCVVGTHTHVQTSDERILPKGTAAITDVGMTGPHDSVIGVQKQVIIERYLYRKHQKFEPAEHDPQLCGVIVDIDEETGKALKIERLRVCRFENTK